MGFCIKNNMNVSFTIIPNNFIDEYMVKANGEFVKVYLYVQSQIQANREHNLSISVIADKLECTEKDVQRAFTYWEKEGLLSLEMEEEGELEPPTEKPESHMTETKTHITESESYMTKTKSHMAEPKSYMTKTKSYMAEPKSYMTKTKSHMAEPESYMAKAKSHMAEPESRVTRQEPFSAQKQNSSSPKRYEETHESYSGFENDSSNYLYYETPKSLQSTHKKPRVSKKTYDPSGNHHTPSKAMLPPTLLQNQIEGAGLSQLAYMADTYLGKPLTSTELNTLFYFYDQLHFSVELIEFLIEYCVTIDKRNMRYIESVALSWYQKNITTVEEAKAQIQTHNKNYYSVMKALGINNRSPIPSEAELIKKWLQTYHFELPIILEACKRTIQKTHQPSFAYADKILSSWHTSKVQSLEDIKALDEEHQLATSIYAKKGADSSKPENRFHNFDQRNYDFDALEKQFDQQFFFQMSHKNG